MLKNNKLNSLTDSFPSIYIIGAQKCGTSTLYKWMKQDKRLLFPKYKETHYFSTNYKLGSNWYLNQFNYYENHLVKCEIDPSYIFHPNSITRILKKISSPKFIVILRRPIERSYSHYLMSKYKGYEKLTFFDALNIENDRIKRDDFSFTNYSYLKRSEYSTQIKKILAHEKNCLFVKFDDLFLNKNKIYNFKNIYKFIGLEYPDNINLNTKSNNAKIYKSKMLRNLLYKDSYLKRIIKKIITSPYGQYQIKSFLDNINYKNINNKNQIYNNCIQQLPKEYIEWNNKEVIKTEKITKLNLNNWLI